MKHPRSDRRLLEQPGATSDPLARALRSALAEDPSSKRLAELAARVDAAVGVGRAPRLSDAPRGAWSGAAWLVAGGVAIIASVFVAVALLPGPQRSALPIAPRVSAPARPVEAAPPAPQLQAPAVIVPAPATAPAAPSRAVRERKQGKIDATRAPGTSDELELLRRAQEALPSDGRAALLLVQEHERAYPHGLLEQERELLAIAALLSLDRVETAQLRAQDFRRTFPYSVHLRRLDRMLAREGSGVAPTGNRAGDDTLTP